MYVTGLVYNLYPPPPPPPDKFQCDCIVISMVYRPSKTGGYKKPLAHDGVMYVSDA